MSAYLDSASIRIAIDALGVCSANAVLADYLIFKRALVLARAEAANNGGDRPDQVVTGTRSTHFVRAVNEVASWSFPFSAHTKGSPYYVPFAAKRDKTGAGYRTYKYPSNGPSDTIARWQRRQNPPLVQVQGSSPMAFTFSPPDEQALKSFLLSAGSGPANSGALPTRVDLAVWWFRFTDVEDRLGLAEPTDEALTRGVVEDLALNEIELAVLFTN